jgi:beta-phosphoglucomutase-like phosphatase (HAD superfamily)
MTELSNSTTVHGWTGASAILFDLDGVLTPTAIVHERAWQELFDGFLQDVPEADSYRESDYFDHIDGKPRFDGVRDFLASRGITLPEGDPDDPPEADTIAGVGNRKNVLLLERLETLLETAPPSVRGRMSSVPRWPEQA